MRAVRGNFTNLPNDIIDGRADNHEIGAGDTHNWVGRALVENSCELGFLQPRYAPSDPDDAASHMLRFRSESERPAEQTDAEDRERIEKHMVTSCVNFVRWCYTETPVVVEHVSSVPTPDSYHSSEQHKHSNGVKMRSIFLLIAILNFASAVVASDAVPLFNGKDLTGWTMYLRPTKDDANPDPNKTWSVVDGTIVCTGKPNGFIATVAEYENYTLQLQWRYAATAKAGNSGVLLHVGGPDVVWPHSIEAQLKSGIAGELWLNADKDRVFPKIDVEASRKDATNKDGRRFFRIDKDKLVEKPFGEWNDIVITCKDGAMTFTINGTKVNEAKGCSLKKGRIALQSEGAEIHFRAIAIEVAK